MVERGSTARDRMAEPARCHRVCDTRPRWWLASRRRPSEQWGSPDAVSRLAAKRVVATGQTRRRLPIAARREAPKMVPAMPLGRPADSAGMRR